MTEVGDHDEAQGIAAAHELFQIGADAIPDGWTLLGTGEHRAAYLAPDGQTVYKVELTGSGRRNRVEHANLTRWRETGHAWAPPTTLHTVARFDGIVGWTDSEIDVIAMPYIADDDTEADLDEIFRCLLAAGCMDLNLAANVRGGYLIDAAGM
jgi:hypothetical protein